MMNVLERTMSHPFAHANGGPEQAASPQFAGPHVDIGH